MSLGLAIISGYLVYKGLNRMNKHSKEEVEKEREEITKRQIELMKRRNGER